MFIKYCFSIANYEIVHGEEKAKNYAANNVKKSGPDYTTTSPRENPNTDWRTQNRLNAQREAGAGKSGTDTVTYRRVQGGEGINLVSKESLLIVRESTVYMGLHRVGI